MAAVSQSSDLESFVQRLPLFVGFPYLVTRIVGPLCHVMLLPADRSEEELRHLATLQVLANRLETYLVLGEDPIHYDIDGTPSRVAAAPRGGFLVAGKLRPAEDFPPTPELAARAERLRVFIESLKQTGFLVCSPQLGYRPATAEEISRLAGHSPDGVPRGLVRCGDCGECRGECLGSAPHSDRQIASVYCRCENHNRCARCGNTLAAWRLHAHHFDRRTGKILFQPSFSGMSHVCSESLRGVQ